MERVCVHHWLCESPVGDKTAARCRKCDAEKVITRPALDWSPTMAFKPRDPIDDFVVKLIYKSGGSI